MAICTIEELICQLYEIKAVKFGDFKLKSGIQSPVYFDLRVIVSYPKIMREVAAHLWKAVETNNCSFKSVCGVPYTALPLATVISADHDIPMLIRRKEAKDYGTKKMIEGHFEQGENCLVIEDVVTSGSSVWETVQSLTKEGLTVTDAVVLLDREQGGKQRLADQGIKLHSVCGLSQLVDVLVAAGKLTDDIAAQTKQFITQNQIQANPKPNEPSAKRMKKVLGYKERASLCQHPVTQRLFSLMQEKRTNLCFSVDVTKADQLLQLADAVGPHICVLKTHIDILEDFTAEVIHKLKQIAETHKFLLFEDRKFADIGNTVKHQYSQGVYRIADWADITNAHAVPGPGVVQGLKEVGTPKGRACLMIAEMSSKGNLATGDYTKASVQTAADNKEFVIGFICQNKLTTDPELVHFTPGVQLSASGDSLGEQYLTPDVVIKDKGVQLSASGDSLGQQYLTPDVVIKDKGTDVIIVGRGILKADDPVTAAKMYQQAGYSAYESLM